MRSFRMRAQWPGLLMATLMACLAMRLYQATEQHGDNLLASLMGGIGGGHGGGLGGHGSEQGGGLFSNEHEQEEGIVDDDTHWVKPGVSSTELLEARGYLAKEFHFTTKDGVKISVTRGRNPLINNGRGPIKGKLPILFIHGATVSAASYLLNSGAVRPRVYNELNDFGHLSTEQLFQHVGADPARKALPFLAMNFGYEVWIMERRGFAGSRVKLGHENRTVADAFKSIPTTLIGNALDGFSLDANMAMARPKRRRFTREIHQPRRHNFPSRRSVFPPPPPWQMRPPKQLVGQEHEHEHEQHEHGHEHGLKKPVFKPRIKFSLPEDEEDEGSGTHFSEKDFKRGQWRQNPLKDFKPKTTTGKIIKRILGKHIQFRRSLGPLRHANVLESFFGLAKLPSTFAQLVGNITTEFVQTFDPEFWRFSLDEQVEFDYPGAVDFVLEQTGAPKVHTVGLSCGGAIILLSLANKPQLAEKISRAVLWAPSVNMGSRTDIVYLLAFLLPLIQGYIGPLPFVFLTPIIEILFQTLCSAEFMQKTICTAALDVIMGHSGSQAPVRPFMLGNLLQPTSAGELTQLGQFARSQFPCKYNHNTKEENIKMYGQDKPPCYDLGQVTLQNISIYGGTKDRLVSADDIATTVAQMSVPADMHIIRKPYNFNHLGCFLHEKADKLILLPSLLDIERANAAELHGGGGGGHHQASHGHAHGHLFEKPTASLFQPAQHLDHELHEHEQDVFGHHQHQHHARSSARFIDFLDGNSLESDVQISALE